MYFPSEMVLIDIETTDHNLSIEPEIVEIGAVKVDRSLSVVGSYQSLIQPKNLDNFTDFSQSFTGIRLNQLERAQQWDNVWEEFAEFTKYSRYRLGSWGIYADIGFLKTAYNQNSIRYPHHKSPICIMSFVAGILSERGIHVTGLGLDAVCKYFNLQRPTHRALEDVTAMLGVLRKLMYEGNDSRDKFELIEV